MFRIAIDPGGTTGFAWRDFEDIEVTVWGSADREFLPGVSEIRAIEWPSPETVTVVLDGFLVQYGDAFEEVVVEGFLSRPGPAVNLTPVEVIGRVAEWCDHNEVRLVRQYPGPVKVRVTNDRLRARGGWFRGQQHARDAAKHLLYREEKNAEISLD
jgi:hypothetical protein